MSVKMREVKNRDAKCQCCSTAWENTPIMYDIGIETIKGMVIITMCQKCADDLFGKLLRATCMWQSKVKGKEDMQRIENAKQMHRGSQL